MELTHTPKRITRNVKGERNQMSRDHIIQNIGLVVLVVGMMYGITVIMDMVRDVDGLVEQITVLQDSVDNLVKNHNNGH